MRPHQDARPPALNLPTSPNPAAPNRIAMTPRTATPDAPGPSLADDLRAAVADRLGPSRFGLWFGDGVRLEVVGDAIEVGVPNAYFRDRIRSHFSTSLIDAARDVTGRALRLDVVLDDEAAPGLGHVVTTTPRPGDRPATTVSIPKAAPLRDDLNAHLSLDPATAPSPQPAPPAPQPSRPSKRLDDFIVGPGSRMAHAAAMELVASQGKSFSPLVIQGGVGLGKTHLLEGIASALRARNPGMKVVRMTGEEFTNGFLEALRQNKLGAFRARYRGAGALLIDDVHFLAAKRATQDEFLHTFNALAAEGAPIVLTTDQHPRRIHKLTDELATRFLGGMLVTLEAPDVATRREILRAKARSRGVNVPDAVIHYVAEHLRASVRELEGALHSLLAHATLSGKKLDLALARTALRDTIRHTARSVGLKDVEAAVCELFQLTPEALKASNRARAIAYPRMIAMSLARKHTGAAYSEIGRFFGGRNHSTVISAEKKVAAWLQEEKRQAWLPGFENVGDVLSILEAKLG